MTRPLLILVLALVLSNWASAAETPTLRGLVLLSTPAELRAVAPPVDGVDASRLRAATRLPVERALAPFVGKPITLPMLDEAARAVSQAFVTAGYPFVAVTTPPQDATAGTVQLLVVESRVGRVLVEGAHSEDRYRGALGVVADGRIDKAELDAAVAWINRNPFRNAQLEAAAGLRPGTTDFTLRVNEQQPLQLSAGFNDSGTRETGQFRTVLGATWGDAFGLGDLMTYNFIADPTFKHTRSHTVGYTAYLPWQHLLTFSASHAQLRGKIEEPLTQKGYTAQVGLGYTIPLAAIGRYEHSVTAQFDAKRSNNDFRFADLPLNNNVTDVLQATLSYTGALPDEWGSTDFTVALAASPGGLTRRNSDESFNLSRVGARARYSYLRIDATRRFDLPYELRSIHALRVQMSSGPLLGSEQLTLGGAAGLRGTRESVFNVDQGFLLRNELHAPLLLPSKWMDVEIGDALDLYGFYDVARGYNRSDLPDPSSHVLHSIGPGLRYTVSPFLSASVEYGHQLNAAGVDGRHSRFHASVRFVY